MVIAFKTNKLEKRCNSRREMVKAWGDRMATELQARLSDLEAADVMSDLPPTPPTRCHPLKGDREGQYAMDLAHPFRLIFEIDHDPVPRLEDGGVDLSKVTQVRILDIEDYHKK